MARSFAKVFVTIWADPDFRALPVDAQRLYLMLLSLPATTHAGTLPLQPRQWSRLAPDTTPDDIDAALQTLIEGRFVLVDSDTEEVLIRSFIRRDEGARTPNVAKSIHASVTQLESARLRTVALTSFAEFDCVKHLLDDSDQPNGEPSPQALPEGQAQGRVVVVGVGEVAQTEKRSNDETGFAAFWAAYPKRTDRKRAATAWRNLTGADRDAAMAALPAHIAQWEREQRTQRLIPHPTTWLHGRRWEDELGDSTPAAERTRSVGGVEVAKGIW